MTDEQVPYPGKPGCDRDGRPLRAGDRVRVERPPDRPVGTWPRYEGRTGWIVVADTRGAKEKRRGLRSETSVSWAPRYGPKTEADSWFVAAEMVLIDSRQETCEAPASDADAGSAVRQLSFGS